MTQPVAAQPGDAKPARNKRILMLVAGGVAVLLIALVLPGVLFGGGDDDSVDETAVPVTVAPTATSTPPVPAPAPETIEVFTNKNPFTPLVDLTPTGSSAGTAPPASGTTTDPPVSGGTTVGSVPATVPPASSPSPTETATTEPRPAQRVSLVDVSTDENGVPRATIMVNDTMYEVAEGEEFAGSYRVVSLSDSEGCAQLLYGDDAFRVCEGEELLK